MQCKTLERRDWQELYRLMVWLISVFYYYSVDAWRKVANLLRGVVVAISALLGNFGLRSINPQIFNDFYD